MKKQTGKKNKDSKAGNSLVSDNAFWNKAWFQLLVLIIITTILYFTALDNEFTNWDDTGYVIDNNYVQHFTFGSIPAAFKTLQVMGNYHPLAMISLGIDHLMYKDNPAGYHKTNLLIHLLNTLLLFYFIQLLFSNNLIAFIAALLFDIHPMHVESILGF